MKPIFNTVTYIDLTSIIQLMDDDVFDEFDSILDAEFSFGNDEQNILIHKDTLERMILHACRGIGAPSKRFHDLNAKVTKLLKHAEYIKIEA